MSPTHKPGAVVGSGAAHGKGSHHITGANVVVQIRPRSGAAGGAHNAFEEAAGARLQTATSGRRGGDCAGVSVCQPVELWRAVTAILILFLSRVGGLSAGPVWAVCSVAQWVTVDPLCEGDYHVGAGGKGCPELCRLPLADPDHTIVGQGLGPADQPGDLELSQWWGATRLSTESSR